MQFAHLVPAIMLAMGMCAMMPAVDAVVVDASGNATFVQPVAAPNILQGSPGVNVTAAYTASFGAWHWISGTTADYTITLPTAVGNAGKTIGLRVKDAVSASKTYTVTGTSGQTIDGATTIALQANAALILMSDGSGWARIGGTPTSALPSGVVLPSSSGAVPAGWLECNGQAVSRTTYAVLFAAVGTTWGAGDGTTTFNVPNLSRRTLVGRGGTGTAALANTVGAVGGEETHVQTIAEMPNHSHNVQYKANGFNGGTWYGLYTDFQGGDRATSATGGGAAFNILQPSAVIVYLIKY